MQQLVFTIRPSTIFYFFGKKSEHPHFTGIFPNERPTVPAETWTACHSVVHIKSDALPNERSGPTINPVWSDLRLVVTQLRKLWYSQALDFSRC